MNIAECIKTRRSIRKFSAERIPHDTLYSIIETASFSPSWKNTQIVRYLCVEDSSLIKAIAADTARTFPHNGMIMEHAPMLVALTILKNRSGFEKDGSFSTPKGSGWQMFDAGVAAQTFCLAAWEHGIGSVIMGIFDEAAISKLLEIPPEQELAALLAIGYPAEEPSAPRRKSAEELLTLR